MEAAEVPQEGERGLVDGNAPVPEEPPAADAAVPAEGDGDEFQIVWIVNWGFVDEV